MSELKSRKKKEPARRLSALFDKIQQQPEIFAFFDINLRLRRSIAPGTTIDYL
jgi:hypothetical protein